MADPDSADLVTLFQQEPSGITYRIPALLYIPEPPAFLAFAEKRSSPDDQDALYLVTRRGVEKHGSIHWEDVIALTSAKLTGHRTMNPCPVYDAQSGTIFLFFICVRTNRSELFQILTGRNAARLCYVTSSDHGKTWSQLRDLTAEVIGDDLKNCATLAVGPGHGIQAPLGRLIVPAYLYYVHSRVCCLPVPCKTKCHSFVFYSDDHGRSWHKGSTLWNHKTCECEVAEVACGNNSSVLYCSARTKEHYRVEAISRSQGLDFANSYFCKSLCEPPTGCQGSVVSYRPPEWKDQKQELDGVSQSIRPLMETGTLSWLLYSHPTSNKKRVDLGIYLNKSPLVPSRWTQPWIINKGPSGYSDLAVCQDSHSFGCLFECGVNACEKITFRRFTLEELMKNVPDP
ncbi:sialidase-3-like [Spea bombifrons]|uniref:sialidase-3-like n=1 Tax=Spea bombifrons TaxID=233779 RepID=UPI00234A9B33|nr:sialidase-3-like [Spea bombifrons]XP_053312619.1 sialidase-3-like [Spea bombifrons]